MRINGFEQIKAFYSWAFENQHKGIKPQHMSLYLFLINQNNRNNWIEWFKVPYDLAMAGSCISSKKTYYACLDDLVKWKLIKYEKGVNNWKAPLIKLEVLKDTSTVPQSEPQVEPQPLQPHIQALIQACEPQPIQNIKLLTNNLKLITDNIKQVVEFVSDLIFEDDALDLDNEKALIFEAIKLKFGFQEQKFINHWRTINAFIEKLFADGLVEHFKEQFENYFKYKDLAKEKEHNFTGFLGTPAMRFENSGWNAENWGEKIANFKAVPANKSKFEQKIDTYNELKKFNPHRK